MQVYRMEYRENNNRKKAWSQDHYLSFDHHKRNDQEQEIAIVEKESPKN